MCLGETESDHSNFIPLMWLSCTWVEFQQFQTADLSVCVGACVCACVHASMRVCFVLGRRQEEKIENIPADHENPTHTTPSEA